MRAGTRAPCRTAGDRGMLYGIAGCNGEPKVYRIDMPELQFKAISPSGEIVESSRNTLSKEDLISELRREGYLVVSVNAGRSAGLPSVKMAGRAKEDLKAFTEEMSILLKSGFTLEVALSVMRSSAALHFGDILEEILSRVREGESLSEALEKHPRHFSKFYDGLVRAGEEGGDLPRVFQDLSDYQERVARIRSEILSAVMYPMVLLVVGIVSVLVLILYIVPKFSAVFSQMGMITPLATRILLAVGNLVVSLGWIVPVGGIGVFFLLKTKLRDPSFRRVFDKKTLGAPIVGDLFLKRNIALFARGLGSLLRGGVELLRAVDIMRGVLPNSQFGMIAEQMKSDVREGEYPSLALETSGLIPEKYIRLIKVGEQSGRLAEMLLRVAEISEKELNRKLQRAIVLIEPAVILALGLIIGSVVISMLLAIFSINEVAF